jgi:hypothetical protein
MTGRATAAEAKVVNSAMTTAVLIFDDMMHSPVGDPVREIGLRPLSR